MYGDEDKATRELVNWGILERNYVNELLPTLEFLIWLYDQKGHALVSFYEYEDDVTAEKRLEYLKQEVKNAIVTRTMQVIKGQAEAYLDCDQHVDIVSTLIKDIYDRRIKIHQKKILERK